MFFGRLLLIFATAVAAAPAIPCMPVDLDEYEYPQKSLTVKGHKTRPAASDTFVLMANYKDQSFPLGTKEMYMNAKLQVGTELKYTFTDGILFTKDDAGTMFAVSFALEHIFPPLVAFLPPDFQPIRFTSKADGDKLILTPRDPNMSFALMSPDPGSNVFMWPDGPRDVVAYLVPK